MYFAHGMLCDTCDDVAEIGFRVNGIELGGFDEGIDDGRPSAPVIRTCEGPVFAAYGDGAYCST